MQLAHAAFMHSLSPPSPGHQASQYERHLLFNRFEIVFMKINFDAIKPPFEQKSANKQFFICNCHFVCEYFSP
jgi:hypothetical protein